MVKRLSTMRETQIQSLCWENPLEKKMAIHSNTTAWKIPWTEEPGRLQSMGLQRVRHDWATSLSLSFSTESTNCYIFENFLEDLRTWAWDVINSCKVSVAQLCPALCDLRDYGPPGSSVHGIFQARILEWVVISFSRGSFQLRDQNWVSYIADSLPSEPPGKPKCLKHLALIWWKLYHYLLHCRSQVTPSSDPSPQPPLSPSSHAAPDLHSARVCPPSPGGAQETDCSSASWI